MAPAAFFIESPGPSKLSLRPLKFWPGKQHFWSPVRWGGQLYFRKSRHRACHAQPQGLPVAHRLRWELEVRETGSLWRRGRETREGGPGPWTLRVRGDFREQVHPFFLPIL